MGEPDILTRLHDSAIYTAAHCMDGLTTALTDARDEIVALRAALRQIRDMETLPDYDAEIAALREAEQEIGKLEILTDSTDAQQRASMKLIATRVLKELSID